MSNLRGKLGLLMAMAIASESFGHSANVQPMPENTNQPPPTPPIPKGCKEYFFDKYGWYSTDRMRRDELVFKCIASNDKTAKAKFQKWAKNNPQIVDLQIP